MKIVVTPPFTIEQKKRIEGALKMVPAGGERQLIFCEKSNITEKLLAEAEVILGNLADPCQVR